MSHFRRIRRWWPVILGVFLLLFLYAAWPGSSTFTISPETTYITEPVDAQGYIDYPTALNERMSKGVTPENNANVLIWQALGPHPEGGTMPAEYFKWLGIESPPETGQYFIDSDKYFQGNLKVPPDTLFGFSQDSVTWKQNWEDRLSRTRKWPWKPSENPDVANWLKQNEKPLALMIEASKRPKYFNPLTPKSPQGVSPHLVNSLIPSVQNCRAATSALSCRAMSRLSNHDLDGAWQDLLAAHRLGQHVASGGTIIEYLVGNAIVSITMDAELALLSHITQPSGKQLLSWLGDLRKSPTMPSLGDKLDLTERFIVLDSLMEVICYGTEHLKSIEGPGSARPKPNEFWNRLFTDGVNWDPALRNANRLFDRYAVASRLPDRPSRTREFNAIEVELDQSNGSVAEMSYLKRRTIGRAKRGELIGNILLGLLAPSIARVRDSSDRLEQRQQNLQLAFALAAFRADTGRYPASLDELAPKYLAKIPDDLFSGKPLIYKPSENGYLLYSVGVNGIDEDGRWMDDEPKGDDLRVRMPVPEPKR